MDYKFIRYIDLSTFMFVLILLLAVTLLYVFVLRKQLQNRLHRIGSSGFDNRFILLERIIVIVMMISVWALFISFNPLINGAITLILFAMFRRVLVDVALGLQAMLQLDLQPGQAIDIAGTKGQIHSLGWTGLFVKGEQKPFFLTYRKMLDNIVAYDNPTIPKVFEITVSATDGTELRQPLVDAVKNILFYFPMLSAQSSPSFRDHGDKVDIILNITNQTYAEGFVRKLEEKGFEVTLNK